MTKELQAPWPDFAGQPIHHGDEIAHPFSGERGTVIYCPDVNSTLEADRWRVIYENANVSRLCLQIGDKGQAVVTQRAFQPAQEPVTLPALDTLKIVARDAFMNGLSWMEANRDSRPEEWRQAADDWTASWVDSENNPLNYPHECAAPGCGCEGHCAADDANDRIAERLRFNAAQKAAPAPAVDRGLSEAARLALDALLDVGRQAPTIDYAERMRRAESLRAALAASAPSQAEPVDHHCQHPGFNPYAGDACPACAPSQAGSCQASGPIDVSAFDAWSDEQKLGYVESALRWAACGYVHTAERIEQLRTAWKLVSNMNAKQYTAPPAGRTLTAPALYVASRASIPARSQMWRDLREQGLPIISTWIDEAGEGETEDFGELWTRIEGEIRGAAGLILYAETGDFPLKGALIEVGIAIGMGRPVAVVLPGVEIEGRTMRPVGSWLEHPLVSVHADVEVAARAILAASSTTAGEQP